MTYKGEKLNTFGEIFGKALFIARYYPNEAEDFFDEYVMHIMQCNKSVNKQTAIEIAKSNFGYFAGYINKKEIYEILAKAYGAYHPIFG